METIEPHEQHDEPRIEYLFVEGESIALDEVFNLLFAKLDSLEN